MTVVLDTSAVLAALWGEPGAERVAPHLPGAAISAVNMAELRSKLVDRGAGADQVAEVVESLGLSVRGFDADQAGVCGELRRTTRAAGLSLADRACLALGLAQDLTVITADRAWLTLDVGARVEVIR